MEDNELKLEDLFRLITGFIKKNMFLILGFVLLGLLVGFFRYSKAQPEYLTNVYAKSAFVPIELFKNEVQSIDALISERNRKEIANKLQLDSTLVLNLKACNYLKISKEENLFAIQVVSTGEQNVNDKFVEHLTAYLSNNEYLHKFLAEERQKIELSIAVYEEELTKLETIQNNILGIDATKSGYSLISNPSELSGQIVKQKNSILGLRLLKEKAVVFNVIDAITVTSNPSLMMFLLSSIVVFTFLGTCLIIVFRFLTLN